LSRILCPVSVSCDTLVADERIQCTLVAVQRIRWSPYTLVAVSQDTLVGSRLEL